MYLRLSRLRLVLLRTGVVFLIVLFLFELRVFFREERNQFLPTNINAAERAFWSKLIDEDKLLTSEQRLEQIRSISEVKTTGLLNWTKTFFDLYQRKIQTLNQRDRTNLYKVKHFENPSSSSAQDVIEIYEETPVGSFRAPANRKSFVRFSRYFNNRNSVRPPGYSILSARSPTVNGIARDRQLITATVVEPMFSIMWISTLRRWRRNSRRVLRAISGSCGSTKRIVN